MSGTLSHTVLPDHAAWPATQERRRPGRIANASPELIALMRHADSPAARAQVALYDAPGFVLPDEQTRPADRRAFWQGALAFAATAGLWAAMFRLMVWAWG